MDRQLKFSLSDEDIKAYKKLGEVMRKRLDKISTTIKLPDNVRLGKGTDEPIIFIPKEGNYVEILGHRIDGDFKSFEDFCKFLDKIKQTEIENEQLKAEKELLEYNIEQIRSYLSLKISEAELEKTYIDGIYFRTIQEELYRNVLDEVNKIVEDKDV